MDPPVSVTPVPGFVCEWWELGSGPHYVRQAHYATN